MCLLAAVIELGNSRALACTGPCDLVWKKPTAGACVIRQVQRTVVKIWNKKSSHSGTNFNGSDLFCTVLCLCGCGYFGAALQLESAILAPFLSFGGRSPGPGFNSPSSAKRSRPACTFLNKKFRLAYCCTAYQETLMLHPRTRSCLCVRKNPLCVRYRCASRFSSRCACLCSVFVGLAPCAVSSKLCLCVLEVVHSEKILSFTS